MQWCLMYTEARLIGRSLGWWKLNVIKSPTGLMSFLVEMYRFLPYFNF